MFVALLPFSAGLMAHLFIHPVSQLFYFGNELLIALLLCGHWSYARLGGLVSENADPHRMGRLTLRVAGAAAALTACLITAPLAPAWSWVPLPVFLLGGIVLESRTAKSPK